MASDKHVATSTPRPNITAAQGLHPGSVQGKASDPLRDEDRSRGLVAGRRGPGPGPRGPFSHLATL
eukprot:6209390-Pleurochrysis_carterae.AAC.3